MCLGWGGVIKESLSEKGFWDKPSNEEELSFSFRETLVSGSSLEEKVSLLGLVVTSPWVAEMKPSHQHCFRTSDVIFCFLLGNPTKQKISEVSRNNFTKTHP